MKKLKNENLKNIEIKLDGNNCIISYPHPKITSITETLSHKFSEIKDTVVDLNLSLSSNSEDLNDINKVQDSSQKNTFEITNKSIFYTESNKNIETKNEEINNLQTEKNSNMGTKLNFDIYDLKKKISNVHKIGSERINNSISKKDNNISKPNQNKMITYIGQRNKSNQNTAKISKRKKIISHLRNLSYSNQRTNNSFSMLKAGSSMNNINIKNINRRNMKLNLLQRNRSYSKNEYSKKIYRNIRNICSNKINLIERNSKLINNKTCNLFRQNHLNNNSRISLSFQKDENFNHRQVKKKGIYLQLKKSSSKNSIKNHDFFKTKRNTRKSFNNFPSMKHNKQTKHSNDIEGNFITIDKNNSLKKKNRSNMIMKKRLNVSSNHTTNVTNCSTSNTCSNSNTLNNQKIYLSSHNINNKNKNNQQVNKNIHIFNLEKSKNEPKICCRILSKNNIETNNKNKAKIINVSKLFKKNGKLTRKIKTERNISSGGELNNKNNKPCYKFEDKNIENNINFYNS